MLIMGLDSYGLFDSCPPLQSYKVVIKQNPACCSLSIVLSDRIRISVKGGRDRAAIPATLLQRGLGDPECRVPKRRDALCAAQGRLVKPQRAYP